MFTETENILNDPLEWSVQNKVGLRLKDDLWNDDTLTYFWNLLHNKIIKL